MKFYIVLFKDGSFKIFKDKQDTAQMKPDAMQFVCSSNVTVQDLHIWASNDFKGFSAIQEIEK
jgi:hypothetical protein